jgi:hypothetical protein
MYQECRRYTFLEVLRNYRYCIKISSMSGELPTIPKMNTFMDQDGPGKYSRIRVFFLLLQSLFALDFGYVDYKSLKQMIFIRLLSISQCVFVCCVCIAHFISVKPRLIHIIWRAGIFLHHFAFVLALLTAKKNKTFFALQKNLRLFDSSIGVDSCSYGIEKYLIIFAFLLIFYRVSCEVIYCNLMDNCPVFISHVLFFMPSLGTDFVLLVHYFVFHCVYHRLKKFTLFVRDCHNIEFCQINYKMIVDCVEKAKDTFDVVVSICFRI